MSGFSADWLTLREGADNAARDAVLRKAAVAWGEAHAGLRVLDLGAGTGATLKVLGTALRGARWWLADNDPALLSRAVATAGELGVTAEPLVVDLAADLAAAFAPKPHLVTASAFFDLAGAAWIDAFAAEAAAGGAAVYAALTYDGNESWLPPHPEDPAVMAAFATDMGRDKGLGPALGGRAGHHLAAALHRQGYRVTTAPSPWRLAAPADAALMRALADGTGSATQASADWRAASRSRIVIGHIDVWAVPA
jgi:hypothetical protein